MAKLVTEHPDFSFFDFIQNKILRNDIEDALLFVAYLVDTSADIRENKYREEFQRVIILYIASVVEAVCLFLVEKHKLKTEKSDIKNIISVSIKDVKVDNGDLIIAIRKKKDCNIKEIPFAETIILLSNANLINNNIKKNLDTLRLKRNSQHLYGRGKNRISKKDVEQSLKTLSSLLSNIKNLQQNN